MTSSPTPAVLPEMLPVIQEDREAYLAMNMLPARDARAVQEGQWDNTTGVQTFARHRIAYSERRSVAGPWYRHVKRGTIYEVIGEVELQIATDTAVDGSMLVIYRGEDGKLWAREEGEFHDGRFVLSSILGGAEV